MILFLNCLITSRLLGFVDHLKESTYIGVDSDFDVFFGIPFAKPPVGDLRFANPERPDPWVDTYDATTVRALCPQPMVGTKDEDCLYLNVYAPNPTVSFIPYSFYLYMEFFIF